MSKDPARVREVLERYYPKYEYSEMDNSHYWKSLDEKQPDELIMHNGSTFRILYAWEWTSYYDVPVFMAEMEVVPEVEGLKND